VPLEHRHHVTAAFHPIDKDPGVERLVLRMRHEKQNNFLLGSDTQRGARLTHGLC
jgi:hypothetical protein